MPQPPRHTRRVALAVTLLALLLPNGQTSAAPPPDFGPNVVVLDPAQPTASMQERLNAIYQTQDRNQFGPERYAVLFKPGHYALDVPVGFYTDAAGLGRSPDDVQITGAVHAEADWLGGGNATCNFWRACENLAVTPATLSPMDWAVSQGTAFRRMHVHGDVHLWDRGWSSGGFLADSQIDGQVASGSQQQWLSRNDVWQGWSGRNWNMTFVGVTRPPAGDWPDLPYTVVPRAPRIREKPFLTVDSKGNYAVFVPALRTNAAGTSWGERGPGAGASVSLDKFYLAHPDKDTAATLNAALDAGKHLLLTPGVYPLDAALRVTHPGTIVLGLGYATLRPDHGTPALTVADVDGVTLAGLLVEAGAVESPSLIQVGPPGSRRDHAKNPALLADVFCRVGGAAPGRAGECIEINSRDVLVDNTWLWRADHGAGSSWDGDPCRSGLVVNGDDVTVYGLFAEHFQGYQTLWNGEGGRVYFYQSELPYDAPSQADWQHDGEPGFAAYKVAPGVAHHEAWGLGIYGVFTRTPPDTTCANAVETPAAPGIVLHHLTTVWITGRPGTEITHAVNGAGDPVNRTHRRTRVD